MIFLYYSSCLFSYSLENLFFYLRFYITFLLICYFSAVWDFHFYSIFSCKNVFDLASWNFLLAYLIALALSYCWTLSIYKWDNASFLLRLLIDSIFSIISFYLDFSFFLISSSSCWFFAWAISSNLFCSSSALRIFNFSYSVIWDLALRSNPFGLIFCWLSYLYISFTNSWSSSFFLFII